MPTRKTRKGRYKIKNVPGTSPTEAAAKRRLRAVKARQRAARKKK